MQELTFVEPGKLAWRETPEPTLQAAGEALVRPIAVATCDIDALIVRGMVPFEGPFPFGHEGVAEVLDTGDAVTAVRPGDLVSVPFQISCGTCAPCRRGRTAHCGSVPKLSSYGLGSLGGLGWGGFLADVVRVPFADHMLLRLPPGVTAESVASLSDNIADAWRAVGPPLEAEPGAPVLIVSSGGSIALYAVAIAVALGAGRVDFVGGKEQDHKVATELGATVIDGPVPNRLGPYPVTVNATSDHAGLACAVRSTAPDGTCTSVGVYFEPATEMPLFEMYTRGIEFRTGRVHARPTMTRALELIQSGAVDPEIVTAQVVGWDEAADALADHRSKVVVSRDRLAG